MSTRLVIVFVVDGLRPDAIIPADAPTLCRLRAEGVEFANAHAALPTVTRVNAATLVTGAYPGTHGIVGNQVYVPDVDPARGDRHRVIQASPRGRRRDRRAPRPGRNAGRAACRAGAPAGRRQLRLDGQRAPDQPARPVGCRRARQRLYRARRAGRVARRAECRHLVQVRAGASQGPGGGAPRRRRHVDPAGAARLRAARARARRRDQLDHRAGPHAARLRSGIARGSRGAPPCRSRDRRGAAGARSPRPVRRDRRLRRVRPWLHHEHRRRRRPPGAGPGGPRERRRGRGPGAGQQRPGRRPPRGRTRRRADRPRRALRPVTRLGRCALHRGSRARRRARDHRRHAVARPGSTGAPRAQPRHPGDVSVDLPAERLGRPGDRSGLRQRRRHALRQRSRQHEPVERPQHALGLGR